MCINTVITCRVNQDMMADQVNLAFLEKEDLRVEEDSLVLQDHQEIMSLAPVLTLMQKFMISFVLLGRAWCSR
jgi:secreted protein with Ig-like and vWFA domain